MSSTGSVDHDSGDGERVVCATCGRVPASAQEAAQARLTWTRGLENARPVWTCDRCSRENLRSIEGKLDSAWW